MGNPTGRALTAMPSVLLPVGGALATVLVAALAWTAAAGDAEPMASGSGATPAIGADRDSVTVLAAGDIAGAPSEGRATAALVRRLRPDAVLALGDNAYESGSTADYARNYAPTWGRFRAITRPVPGNHEYRTSGAAGYFGYFRAQVHGNAYYAWDAGPWRMYALNCEIDCGAGSAQLRWLRRDLTAHRSRPSLAYVHRPRFSCSSEHDPFDGLVAVWGALQKANGRIMLAGHNHAYERFALLDPSGRPAADGLRQFVVGTGGHETYPLDDRCAGRQAADDSTAGVLRLVLSRGSYTWQFVATDGRVIDRGRTRF